MGEGRSGAIAAVGIILMLMGLLLFILGLVPALQTPAGPANLPEVAFGALFLAFGFFFVRISR